MVMVMVIGDNDEGDGDDYYEDVDIIVKGWH